jgi:hypothetical protein
MDKPYGVPADFAEHFRLMSDMVTIAFQADQTRVLTFLVTHEGTSRAYREIGISDGHHPLTHHMGNMEKLNKVAEINLYQMKQFALWMQKMKATKDGDGSLLDHSMIVYGAGMSDGNGHDPKNLPILLLGAGCGALKSGRHIRYQKGTPLANMHLALLNKLNVPLEKIGDSTGELTDL